jgi:C4-dicarboxylate-specific signal transduction histidine kinase
MINNVTNISERTEVFAYLNVAEAYLMLEDNMQAIEWVQKAVNLAEKSAVDELTWFSYLYAIKIFKANNDLAKALHYSELRQALTEKIYKTKLNDKLEEIETGRQKKLDQNNNVSYNEKTIRMASLGVMASGIAHEINQPLNAIMIDAQAMIYKDDQEKVLPIGYRERIEYIIKATDRISKIVNHIRYYWKPKNSIQKQELDVNEVISSAVSYLDQQIKAHQIVLKLIFVPKRLLIYSFQVSLEQIIINLVTNSVQALDNVNRSKKRITISTSAEDDMAIIIVDDNGDGIPPEISENIFNPFVSSKEEGYGTGLGLTLVQNFAKDMNAQISHSQNKLGGCRFTIKIPLLDSIKEK